MQLDGEEWCCQELGLQPDAHSALVLLFTQKPSGTPSGPFQPRPACIGVRPCVTATRRQLWQCLFLELSCILCLLSPH